MIKFYYKEKLICHVSTIGANVAQVQACRGIVAEKMNVDLYAIKLRF